MPTVYRCVGNPTKDQYEGNYDLSGSRNKVFGRHPNRDIMSWLHSYEVMPSQLGLTGILPEEYFDSQGNKWVKVSVAHIAQNDQFTADNLGGKMGIVGEHGQNFVSPYKEKYPPVDENPGVFMVRQGSYLSELKKNGLIK